MPHRRSRSGFASTPRQVQWIGPADQGYFAVAATTSVIVASFTPLTNGIMVKPTIVRTRGNVSHRPSVNSADVAYVGAIGVCVVSQEAFTAGAASIPRPHDDADWGGWLVWRSFSESLDVTTDIGRLINSNSFEVDSKAMRKMGINDVMVTMAESQSGAYDISDQMRHLFKLS